MYKEIVVPIILKHAPQVKIILYGSRARKDESQGSDIDIALDIGMPMDQKIMNAIIHDLEKSKLPIYFDIVDFHGVSEAMQKDIVNEGVVWQK